jgi:hypothetical protein
VRLGSRGLREVGGRIERIEDDELRAAVRRRALVVTVQSLLIAAAVTVAAWMIPSAR